MCTEILDRFKLCNSIFVNVKVFVIVSFSLHHPYETPSSSHSSLWNLGAGGNEATSSAQLLCATYRVSPIVIGKFVVVNTGHYSPRSSLSDVSTAWKASLKCREL